MRQLFPGAGRRAWYWRVRLSGLPSYSGASSAAAYEAEPGPLSRQSTEAFRSISFPWFLARAVRTWKCGALFLYGLVPCSPVSGVLVLLVEYRELDHLARNAWLDCGYMICISTWHFWTICTHFYGEGDSNSEVFSLRPHAAWRSVLSRCFSSQSWYASSHWENWTLLLRVSRG